MRSKVPLPWGGSQLFAATGCCCVLTAALMCCFDQGLTKAVGVSNFNKDRVRNAAKVLQARGTCLSSNQVGIRDCCSAVVTAAAAATIVNNPHHAYT